MLYYKICFHSSVGNPVFKVQSWTPWTLHSRVLSGPDQLRVLSLVQHKRASSATILNLDYLVLHQDPFCLLFFETNHPCFKIQSELIEICSNRPSPSSLFIPFTSCFRCFSHFTRDVTQCEFAGALLRRMQAKTPENKDTPKTVYRQERMRNMESGKIVRMRE